MMPDDRLDALLQDALRDARRTYNRPPDLADTEALWARIDAALPTPAQAGGAERPPLAIVPAAPAAPSRRPVWTRSWLRMAAVLVLGVAIGRASVGRAPSPAPAPTVAERAAPDAPAPLEPTGSDAAVTTEYLDRTNALLAALPAALESRRADPAYLSQAEALLLQTRLLLDSPAATDPALRSLFDDLEIVLAQVVRLRADRDPTRIDFLEQALEQRDVLPRLRDAVADAAAD